MADDRVKLPTAQVGGPWVVATIFALAAGAALFAWGWRKSQTDDCLHFWGAENAETIRAGERITLLRLGPSDGSNPAAIAFSSGKKWPVAGEHDVSKANGMTHARRALIEDSGFDWTAIMKPLDPNEPQRYEYAVRFERGQHPPVTVVFDFSEGVFHHVESGKSLRARAKLVQGWRDYAGRHAGEAPKSPPQRSGEK